MRLDQDNSKRSPTPSRIHSNGSNGFSPRRADSSKASANGSAKNETNGSASNTNGPSAPPPLSTPYLGHDREEVTRILIQALTDMGYSGAADRLSQESGVELEGDTVAAFRGAVLKGDWAEAEALLFGMPYDDGGGVGLTSYGQGSGKMAASTWSLPGSAGLTLTEDANRNEMMFLMRQQKFLELLEQGERKAALDVLQRELTPLHQHPERLHSLSALIMSPSTEDLKNQAQWDGAAGQSRNLLLSELSKSISPSVMIPEHRLGVLFDQVKERWTSECLYHNTTASPSLYVDHACEPWGIPSRTILELRHHMDEVWFLRFSHDGTRLATTSKDATVVIYDTSTYKVLHKLAGPDGHECGVCYVAWSPDDSKVVTCSQQTENSAKVWDTKTGQCLLTIHEFTYAVTSAAWSPNGETFITGSQDTDAALCIWNLAGQKIHQWKEDQLRVHDLAISRDGQRLVVLLEQRILLYDFVTKEKLNDIEMKDVKLTSLNLSADSRYMLVSMNQNKIRLMDLETGALLRTYSEQKQTEFIIRSAFGGANENFVVSGSEDSRVYIWRTNGRLVHSLPAHQGGCVNAVAWHPTDPTIFASAGDDHKVRIWSLPSPSSHNDGYSQISSTSNGFAR